MGRRDYLKYKEHTRALVKQKLAQYNQVYGFKINRVAIKNTKSRWGSCSKKCNLNFNYRLVLLPERLADYVIVHELCHLGEFNHSKNFWKLVAMGMQDYLSVKKQFKKIVLK